MSVKSTNISPMAVPYRTGDVVVVQALKVQNTANTMSEVLLKFPDGDLLTAVLKDGFMGKEGDFFSIRIQSLNDNRIYAKIVANVDGSKTLKNEITHLLTNLNAPNTADNYQIAMQMLRSGIAQTKYNFDLFIRYKKRYQDSSFEQIAFLLKHKMPVNEQTVKIAELLMSHQGLVGEDIIQLLRQINDEDRNDELKDILKRFYKNPLDETFQENEIKTSKTIDDLIKLLQYLKERKSLGVSTNELVKSFITNIESKFEFATQLHNPFYLQIPINNNGNYDTAELYILKEQDSEHENKQNTIFIRIPTFYLGIVEILIHVDSNKGMQCHFNSPEHINEIQNNIVSLYEMINELGFRLTKVTYDHLPSNISIHNFEKYVELMMDKKKFDARI